MTVINTNTAATLTANALTKNERAMSQAMERLSTGVRINSASDDAAGLAISSRMTSQINGLNMAVRNANDAISMVQTEDGAMIEVTNMLQRMRELAVQASSGTMGPTDRAALDTEFVALASQIQTVGSNTQWNGTDLLDGVSTTGAQRFQVGANASQTISHTFADLEASNSNSDTTTLTFNTPSSSATIATYLMGGATTSTFAVGDTISFNIDSVVYSGTVKSVDSTNNGIESFQMHGSSTVVNASTDDTTTIPSSAASGAFAIGMHSSNDNTVTITGTTTGNSATFTGALLTTTNDGATSFSKGTVTSGLAAATMYADISTVAGATSALKSIDQILTDVNTARASSGAVINRLEYAADNLANVSQNTSASRSRILDADYASETTELARTQIIQQAGTAMLSQANQQAQSVLALLK